MIRSALSTMSVPPATHHPCTAASVGLEISCSRAKARPKVEIIRTSATVSHTGPSDRSPTVDQSRPKPAQNAGPSAGGRTALTAGSPSSSTRTASPFTGPAPAALLGAPPDVREHDAHHVLVRLGVVVARSDPVA